MAVSRTQGQPAFLPDDRMGDDLNGKMKGFDHVPDDLELLIVLFAEDVLVGEDGLKEFFDNGHDALKVSGAFAPAEVFVKALEIKDLGGDVVSVHFFHTGKKDTIHTLSFAGLEIVLPAGGIFFEVFLVVELCGVEKNTDDNNITDFFSQAHQGPMTLVKTAQGRDKGDGEFFSLDLPRIGLHVRDGVDDFHRGVIFV